MTAIYYLKLAEECELFFDVNNACENKLDHHLRISYFNNISIKSLGIFLSFEFYLFQSLPNKVHFYTVKHLVAQLYYMFFL